MIDKLAIEANTKLGISVKRALNAAAERWRIELALDKHPASLYKPTADQHSEAVLNRAPVNRIGAETSP